MRGRFVPILLGLGSLAIGLHAEELRSPKGFGAPTVVKLDWDTRSLRSGDINGDGLNDLLVVNNDRGRIDFLLGREDGETPPPMGRSVRRNRWEPVLEDALFWEENLATGFALYDAVADDFNGDGLVDVAYTSGEVPLSVRYQMEDGGFESAVVFERFSPLPWIGTLLSGDVDGDGRTDLLALGEKDILFFRQGEEDGVSGNPERIRLTSDEAYGLGLADINGDGVSDLFYTAGSGSRAFRVRFQEESGSFGPEYAFDLNIGPGVVSVLRGAAGESTPIFSYIAEHSGAIDLFEIRVRESEEDGFESVRPAIYSVSSGDVKSSYAYGDFDGDGVGELAVADPSESSILLYRQDGEWDFQPPQTFPSLLGISELVAVPSEEDGVSDLVVFSGKENLAGLSRMTAEGRFSFPIPLPVEGEVQTLTSGDLENDGSPALFVVTKMGREYRLVVLSRGGEDPSGYRQIHDVEIPVVKRSPGGLVVFDLNGDGKSEMVLLAPREPARIFQLAGADVQVDAETEDSSEEGSEESLIELAAGSSIRKSLLNDLSRNRIGFGDVDGDGTAEMIVAADGYARAVGFDDESRFVILDQFNALSSGDAVRIPTMTDVDGDGVGELLFYESGEGKLQRLERDDKGVLRYRDSAAVGNLDVQGVLFDSESSTPRLLVLGADRFWVLPLSSGEWEKVAVASYETDLLDISPTSLAVPTGPVTSPSPIIAVDGRQNVIELLEWTPPDEWSSLLHFTVFEKNLHYRGRVGAPLEPREVLLDDMNGDGILDLVVLVHDRVLVYPGQ
tara:strand:- start:136 stop:2499 length:2364 start_codon:yes stop_codon:yes gene_type:complete